MPSQITKFMEPTWGPPGSCRPQMGPMLAPWTLQLSGMIFIIIGCDIEGPSKWIALPLQSSHDQAAQTGFWWFCYQFCIQLDESINIFNHIQFEISNQSNILTIFCLPINKHNIHCPLIGQEFADYTIIYDVLLCINILINSTLAFYIVIEIMHIIHFKHIFCLWITALISNDWLIKWLVDWIVGWLVDWLSLMSIWYREALKHNVPRSWHIIGEKYSKII